MNELAIVGLAMDRHYLQVAGVILAVEGDKCRDSEMLEEILPPIPEEELAHASIGGIPAKELDTELVRFFRGDCWDKRMLEWTAAKINAAARKREEDDA